MNEMVKKLFLYEVGGIKGYLLKDIEVAMPQEEFKQFCEWMYGQTGAITEEGDLLVYKHDLARFLRGLDVID